MYENAAQVPLRAMEMKAINARRIAAKEARCASERLGKDCIGGGRRRSRSSCAATPKSNSHLFAELPFRFASAGGEKHRGHRGLFLQLASEGEKNTILRREVGFCKKIGIVK